jgi:hypothetical protein
MLRGREQNLRVLLSYLSTCRRIMSSTPDIKNTPPTEAEKAKAKPATGKDAENQPADSTHDEREASTQVQRTETEGPRRMPQP